MKGIIFLLLVTLIFFFSGEKHFDKYLENEKNSIFVFQNTAASIVHVSNMRSVKNLFSRDEMIFEDSVGSGFVWDHDGHIITSFHVVYGGEKFMIMFRDNKKLYPAQLVGIDPINDIAVLKLKIFPPQLKPISVGSSQDLQVGQKALAIGNPLGLDHTLTTGTISAINRKIRGLSGFRAQGMIQTDASINPGNSGGALLDSQGKLIGINSLIFNAAGFKASAGLGFAIPVDTVRTIVPQLIKYGRIVRAGLGISLLDEFYAAQFGVRFGVMIKHAEPDGPASRAGLKGPRIDLHGRFYVGDVIVGINNIPINNSDELYLVLEKYKVGEKIRVKYLRDHREKIVEVILSQI